MLPRHDLPIKIDQKCLSHQTSGQDTQMTMRLFKLACLAYTPSKINYRNLVIDRKQMIQMRRSLIDRISNLLPHCELFKEQAIYPRRYFDDLMMQEKRASLNISPQSPSLGDPEFRSRIGLTANAPNLNNNSSAFLPDVNQSRQGGNMDLPFGIGQKIDYNTASL